MGKMEGSIPRWHREITSLPRVQAGLRAQVGSPLRGTWPEPSGGSLPQLLSAAGDHPLPWGSIHRWLRERVSLPGVQRGLKA